MKSFLITFIVGVTILGLVKGQDGGCGGTGQSPYDYSQALCMSILFYDAQKSGALNGNERFDWRGDSALTDGQDVGHDLTGGYYDAGDFVKFGLPMAYTVTVLAYSLLSYPNGYSRAGQTDYARGAVRWGAEYFLKAHTSQTELYGQVGDGNADHANWGRPEEMTEQRPSAKIDSNNPGSDLAGETAAALAATSIVFSSVDSDFSSRCLQAARELFDLADNHRGNYNNAISGSTSFYASGSFEDEITWAALWLYRATGDTSYRDKASNNADQYDLLSNDASWPHNFDWDNKNAGIMALGAEIDSGNTKYNTALANYANFIRSNTQRTPQGLIYIMEWGTLRHASNVAFILFRAASLGIDTDSNKALAQSQVDYVLGSTGRSFVVGFGNNPPQRPHHRSSSCPDQPATCDWNAYNSADPNPQVLYGALVGGPDQNDQYTDSRDDYTHNEVACDYNAALTGAFAAAVESH